MKRLTVLLCIISVVLFSACLVYQEMTVTITFDDKFQYGSIEVMFSGISSSDSSQEKLQADFDDLVGMLEEDDLLLDMVEDGIYLKERRLYEKEGVLYGNYSGIFRQLNIDGERLQGKGNKRILEIDIDQGDQLTSNGQIDQRADSTFIIWPKDSLKLVYTVRKSYSHNVYSLLPHFTAWKR